MPYAIMALTYTWWRGDNLPALLPVPQLRCEPVVDVPLLARLHQIEPSRIEARLADENTAYVAFIGDEPAGYGWSAARSMGVAGVFWPVNPPSHGLWDFFTLEGWRGRGIYPHLLQAILRKEQMEAEKFWIGHRADNYASRRGIEKAGFQLVNFVVVTPEQQVRLAPRGNLDRAQGDPQSVHFGNIETPDEDMSVFDFGNLTDQDLEQLGREIKTE